MLHHFLQNERYNEEMLMLGEVKEIDDTTAYLVFKPHNGIGATVERRGQRVNVRLMRVDCYEPLIMWTHPDYIYWNLSEEEALRILINQFGNLK